MQQPYTNQGLWAIILGGSGGLGKAAAKQLAASGMNLCLVYRERKAQAREFEREIEEMRDLGIKVCAYNKDASKPESMNEILQSFRGEMNEQEKVRLLLHAVAKGNLKPIYAQNENPVLESQDFELTIDSMALNWHRWAMAILAENLFAEDARLLALTSEGSQKAWPGYGAVAAAKATLEALMRNMALELAPLGLRCNVLQPGVTDTTSLRMIPGSTEMKEASVQRNPFKRLTTPEDVARVIDLMCRDESAWINGAIIPVDGGESISG